MEVHVFFAAAVGEFSPSVNPQVPARKAAGLSARSGQGMLLLHTINLETVLINVKSFVRWKKCGNSGAHFRQPLFPLLRRAGDDY